MKGFGIGLIFSFIIKIALRVFDVLMYIIADLLIYFGLWIPSLYMLITGGFMLFGNLDITVPSVPTVLFYVGLSLALIGSIIITVRNMILKPLKDHIKYRAVRKEYKRNQAELKRKEMYQKHPDKYFAKYEEEAPPLDHPVYNSTRKTRTTLPHKTYRSKQDPTLIIHEYDEKYIIYKDCGDHFYQIDEKKKLSGNPYDKKKSTANKKKGRKND